MPHRTRTDIAGSEIEPSRIIAEIDHDEAPAEPQIAQDPEPVPPTASPKPPAGKFGELYGKIAGPAGTTIDDLVASTGWQPHTIRAAVSRLRRRGLPVVLATDADGRKAYRLEVREG